MTLQLDPQLESKEPVVDRTESTVSRPDTGKAPRPSRRPKKMSSRLTMWIRRIHLFSGLFMLPWVLLYGFTALLFNHPTIMAGSGTTIDNFALSESDQANLPSAPLLVQQAIAAANAELEKQDLPIIEVENRPEAWFTRQAFGSLETDDGDVSVILDLNSGSGYVRTREKQPDGDEGDDQAGPSLERGVPLAFDNDSRQALRDGLATVLKDQELDPQELQLRNLPNIEFDAMVGGESVRLRLSQQQQRRRGGSEGSDDDSTTEAASQFKGQLSLVGANPREMSARSFLLRLHMAHGYPVVNNSRWFWAIAVDAMFASMCFWGISGVVMWWQIKRTRRLGFALLLASAVVATWLAIGMHGQLTNG